MSEKPRRTIRAVMGSLVHIIAKRRKLHALIACVAIGLRTTAHAGVLLVAGSPTYDSATRTGFPTGQVLCSPGWGVNNSGTAVGMSETYVNGHSAGIRAVRWDTSGTAATELDSLGTSSTDVTDVKGYAINTAGTVSGCAQKYVGSISQGVRAVRWDALSTAATELGNLGTDSSGVTNAYAYAINDAGTAVGYSQKYVGSSYLGYRAVRWDASGTAATELGNLGTDSSGFTNAYAHAVNAAGTVVGHSAKYIGGSNKGSRAVRWDASGTAATELDSLGTTDTGMAIAYAYAVNDAGTAVGYSQKYVGNSVIGTRAVRWDASGTAATELGNLDTHSSGITNAKAYAINSASTAVGYSSKYVSGALIGDRAVVWMADTRVIDLNDLGVAPVPAGGTWTLTTAKALSPDGWVAGEGTFDPDGTGPQGSYTRLWVAQVGLGGTWTKPTDGTWGRGPNWSSGTPAMQVGNATFDLDAAYTVALDRDERTKTIAISAGTVTINFGGHTLATESGLSIAQNATLKGAGTIGGNLILNGGTINFDAPGAISGSLTVANGGNWAAKGMVAGLVTVTGGVFKVAGSLANNGSNTIRVAKDMDGVVGNGIGDAQIIRRVSPGTATYTGLGAAIANLGAGELPTTADLLAGNASAQADVTMAWRVRTDVEKTQGDGGLISEVLNLDGIAPSDGSRQGSQQTDLFVLQMSYDPGDLLRIWNLSESQAVAQNRLCLGSLDVGGDGVLDGGDDRWIRAVDGNVGGTPNFVGNHAYNSDYLVLGDYGVDTSNHVVWAVINHNSQFAAIPEPSTSALLGAGAIGLLGYTWHRRRVR